MTKEKQPYPNHNWCVGCTPDSCYGCGTEPADRRKPAVDAAPVGYFEQEYVGGPVLFYQVNYSEKDRLGVIPLFAHAPDSAKRIAALEKRIAELEADAERMNFIEAHPNWLSKVKKHWQCVMPSTNYDYPVFNTAREAIDAAMGAKP